MSDKKWLREKFEAEKDKIPPMYGREEKKFKMWLIWTHLKSNYERNREKFRKIIRFLKKRMKSYYFEKLVKWLNSTGCRV